VKLNLRWRLTLFYGAISAVIVLIGSAALYFSLRSSLYVMLDDGLRDAAMSVARADRPGPPPRGDGFRRNGGRGGDDFRPRVRGDTVLTIFDSSGKATTRLEDSPVSAPLEPGIRTVDGYRVLTMPLQGGEWVQAARLEGEALGALSRTQNILAFGLPLLLLLGLTAGYFLADSALKPVDAVTRLAARIAASGKSGERVPQAIGNDEMARLTGTVNAMLEKLEALIQQERAFALAAAHELRTPLSVLQARVSLSLERERTGEQYRTALHTVAETTQKLNQMVESLLTLARSHVPAGRSRADLADIALEASELHSEEAHAKGQHMHLDLDSAPCEVDPSSLRLAASNLIRNAVLYGRAGGAVWIQTSSDAHTATLEVRDDGAGVNDEDLERLRHPFQRGHGLQAVSGSGLGLALVDAVARQHDGTLILERAAEGGLRAAIRVPLARTSS
jgi:two-component system sensor histidine kinase MprB